MPLSCLEAVDTHHSQPQTPSSGSQMVLISQHPRDKGKGAYHLFKIPDFSELQSQVEDL